MAKDKKDKKAKKKAQAANAGGKNLSKARSSLEAIIDHPAAAEIVAAALVATASALKDSKRARLLASEAGDALNEMVREGAGKGNALWKMAIEIGRRSLEAMANPKTVKAAGSRTKVSAKPKTSGKKRVAKAKTASKPTTATKGKLRKSA